MNSEGLDIRDLNREAPTRLSQEDRRFSRPSLVGASRVRSLTSSPLNSFRKEGLAKPGDGAGGPANPLGNQDSMPVNLSLNHAFAFQLGSTFLIAAMEQ